MLDFLLWNKIARIIAQLADKTSGMEAAAMLADLIENDTGISKEIKMGCELVLR